MDKINIFIKKAILFYVLSVASFLFLSFWILKKVNFEQSSMNQFWITLGLFISTLYCFYKAKEMSLKSDVFNFLESLKIGNKYEKKGKNPFPEHIDESFKVLDINQDKGFCLLEDSQGNKEPVALQKMFKEYIKINEVEKCLTC